MKKFSQWLTFNLISIAAFAGGHTVTITQTNVLCNGDCNGTASAIVSEGVGPFVYSWSNGSTGITTTGLCAATYSCTVTDNNDWSTTTATVVITEPSAIIPSTTYSPTICGLTTGEAFVSVTGGTPPFMYSWSNGATSQTINNLAEGTYSVTVADANSCIKKSMAYIITVGQYVYVSIQSDVTCYGGNDGSAEVWTSGGTNGVTFNWSNGATGITVTGLSAGTYTVTGTDANGCKSISTVAVTEPAAIAVNTFSTDAVCGMSNGVVSAMASGGTGLLTYSWNTGSSNYITSGVSASIYTVTITDASGCTTSSTTVVSCVTGIDEFNDRISFSMYPNPSNGSFTFKSQAEVKKCTIMDVLGNVVYSEENIQSTLFDISLSQLSSGIYFLKVTDVHDIEKVQKVIIEH